MEARTSLSSVLRRAEQVLAARHAVDDGVAVMWQRPGEELDTFSVRVNTARRHLPHTRLLLVACAAGAAESGAGVVAVELPPVMLGLLTQPARYRVCYGGRGAGRSWSFARSLLVKALERKHLVLCGREFQNAISESVYRLLCDQIERLGLSHLFEVQAASISAYNGSEFIFAGIRNNPSKIKSTEGVTLAFIEEAEKISNASWEILIPTVRAACSEIWVGFNPQEESDPSFVRFVSHPPDNAVVLKTSYADNPWFPPALEEERLYLAKVDDDAYRHVWLGECRLRSDAQVFHGKYVVEEFTPQEEWSVFFGLDFGFAADPTAGIRAYVHERTLYIAREAWGLHIDIDRTPALLDELGADARKFTMHADSARPETISYLIQHGYPNVLPAPKWQGSVEDGITFIRQFERVVIHPRCTHTIEEFRTYRYKTDKLSGNVLPDLVDASNHLVDALRYGLSPLIQGRGPAALMAFYREDVPRREAQLAKEREGDAHHPIERVYLGVPLPRPLLPFERAKAQGGKVDDL